MNTESPRPTRAAYRVGTDVACFALVKASGKDSRKVPIDGTQSKWEKQKSLFLAGGDYHLWRVSFSKRQTVTLMPANRKPLDPDFAAAKLARMHPTARGREYLQAVADGRVKPIIERERLAVPNGSHLIVENDFVGDEFTVPHGGAWYWIMDPCEVGGVEAMREDAELRKTVLFNFSADGEYRVTAGDGEITVSTMPDSDGHHYGIIETPAVLDAAANRFERRDAADAEAQPIVDAALAADDAALTATLRDMAGANPCKEFWAIWRAARDRVKSLGFRVTKLDGEFVLLQPQGAA